MSRTKPSVGFAFSGASSRSVFYIGFLEVLSENNFPVNFISAMSGSAVVAASYASGTLPELKKLALGLNKELVFSLIERSKGRGGLYSLDKVESQIRVFTQNKRFEDVTPKLGFVATDIKNGEEVVLQIGDIAHAVCASCTLPGIFEPLEWGSRQLVDGGIVNIVPGNVARSAGMDLVIGVDMRATRHIFSQWQISLKKVVDIIKHILWPSPIDKLWHKFSELLEYPDLGKADHSDNPRLYTVLDRSMDLAIKAQAKHYDSKFECDLLIVPDTSHMPFWKRYLFTHFTDFSKTQSYYTSGRETAKQYLPQLWQMLADEERKILEREAKVKTILTN